jgi:hypothetical protein
MSLSALSIIIQVEASTGVVFFDISIELAYLCVQVGLTVIYTLLVANRLLTMRGQLRQVMGEYDSSTYDTIVLMVVESALAYTVFAIVFIIAFALHNNGLTTMCFLSIGKVQVSRQNRVSCISDTSFFIELGHCTIVHHPSCCKGTGSSKQLVDPSCCGTYYCNIFTL